MIKIQIEGSFNGTSTKKDGIADVKFKFPMTEIANASQLLMLINVKSKCKIKVDNNDYVIPEGMFKSLKIDGEGESTFVFETFCNNLSGIDAVALVNKSITVLIASIDGGNP